MKSAVIGFPRVGRVRDGIDVLVMVNMSEMTWLSYLEKICQGIFLPRKHGSSHMEQDV